MCIGLQCCRQLNRFTQLLVYRRPIKDLIPAFGHTAKSGHHIPIRNITCCHVYYVHCDSAINFVGNRCRRSTAIYPCTRRRAFCPMRTIYEVVVDTLVYPLQPHQFSLLDGNKHLRLVHGCAAVLLRTPDLTRFQVVAFAIQYSSN